MHPRVSLRPWASSLNSKVLPVPSIRISPPAFSSSSSSSFSLRTCQQQTTMTRSSLPSTRRQFSTSPALGSWLTPRRGHKGKSRKGRPRVRTGGSTRGTSMIWGDYGLRMCDHDRRVSSAQLQVGWNTIRARLRGMKYRMVPRVAADRAVFTKGNEMRMGKGKGAFDYYASRVAVNHMIFELKGDVHEKVVRDAFRLAAAKMPGKYEFVRAGDPPIVGLTKVMEGMTLESIKRPWLVEEAARSSKPPRPKEPLEKQADRLPATTPP